RADGSSRGSRPTAARRPGSGLRPIRVGGAHRRRPRPPAAGADPRAILSAAFRAEHRPRPFGPRPRAIEGRGHRRRQGTPGATRADPPPRLRPNLNDGLPRRLWHEPSVTWISSKRPQRARSRAEDLSASLVSTRATGQGDAVGGAERGAV